MSIRLVAGAQNGNQHTLNNHDKEGFNIIDGRVVYDIQNAMYVFKGIREDTKEEVRFYKFAAYECGNNRHIVVDRVKHKILSLKGQAHFAVDIAE
jgi:hypothetical protein